jgi:hypothetical protein
MALSRGIKSPLHPGKSLISEVAINCMMGIGFATACFDVSLFRRQPVSTSRATGRVIEPTAAENAREIVSRTQPGADKRAAADR